MFSPALGTFKSVNLFGSAMRFNRLCKKHCITLWGEQCGEFINHQTYITCPEANFSLRPCHNPATKQVRLLRYSSRITFPKARRRWASAAPSLRHRHQVSSLISPRQLKAFPHSRSLACNATGSSSAYPHLTAGIYHRIAAAKAPGRGFLLEKTCKWLHPTMVSSDSYIIQVPASFKTSADQELFPQHIVPFIV